MSSFDKFIKEPTKFFKYLAIDFTIESNLRFKFLRIAMLINIVLLIILQIMYNIFAEYKNLENIIYISYCFMSFGKILAIMHNRVLLVKCVEQLRDLFPTRYIERKYRLQYHIQNYLWFERFIINFYIFICCEFLLMPLLQSYLWFRKYNEYPFIMPAAFWIPKKLEKSVLVYIFEYILFGFLSGLQVTTTNAGCDLFLICCISQLCLHFDLLSQRIMELQPGEDENKALENLKAITRHHREIIK